MKPRTFPPRARTISPVAGIQAGSIPQDASVAGVDETGTVWEGLGIVFKAGLHLPPGGAGRSPADLTCGLRSGLIFHQIQSPRYRRDNRANPALDNLLAWPFAPPADEFQTSACPQGEAATRHNSRATRPQKRQKLNRNSWASFGRKHKVHDGPHGAPAWRCSRRESGQVETASPSPHCQVRVRSISDGIGPRRHRGSHRRPKIRHLRTSVEHCRRRNRRRL
jgi:hypothetical protein